MRRKIYQGREFNLEKEKISWAKTLDYLCQHGWKIVSSHGGGGSIYATYVLQRDIPTPEK